MVRACSLKILGFKHEFARPDRDDYIIMYSDNWLPHLVTRNGPKMSLNEWENTGPEQGLEYF